MPRPTRALALTLAALAAFACTPTDSSSDTNADTGAPAPPTAGPQLPDTGGPARDATLTILDAERLDTGGSAPDLAVLDTDASPETADAAVQCAPGIPAGCVDRAIQRVCADDGSRYLEVHCPLGAACRAGECVSDCQVEGKDPAYIGCTYWSLDLDNYPDPFGDPSAVPHAVVLGNASAAIATVTITRTDGVNLLDGQLSIPPGEVAVYTFPRLDVDGSGITDRSFKIQSDWPIAAYQFNPLNNVGVASNDGTVLIPDEALGREYYAVTWPTSPVPIGNLPPQHGYFTVLATRPGVTTVQVTVTGDVEAGDGVPAMAAGTTQTFMLEEGQVLNIEADGSNLFSGNLDLTGSHIVADQPVAAFGGHEEAVVGNGCCAEHLEHQLFPVETWGLHYLAAHSEPRGGSTDVWRIVAAQDGTTVQTLPPQGDAGQFTLNAGEWREIGAADSFEVTADKPISVAQYLASQETTSDGLGDPSLILAVPVEQFRTSYLILTPADYTEDWLTVIRPLGATVFLDGEALPDGLFMPIGAGDFDFAWVPVDDGPHTLLGEAPFGLVAMGYSQAVSYGYAAGLDLRPQHPGL